MSKAIVIYSSRRGSTERYAKWIAQDLRCEAVAYKNSASINLAEYDVIIYGGWLRGSGIVDFDNFKKRLNQELIDKLIVFGVGIGKETVENYKQIYEINYKGIFRDGEKNPTLYVLGGAYDPAKVHGFDKVLMASLKVILKTNKAKDRTGDTDTMIDHIKNGVDKTNRKNVVGIVREARRVLMTIDRAAEQDAQ